jgi:galactokinase
LNKFFFSYMIFLMDIGQIHQLEYEAQSEPPIIAEAPGRIHYLGDHGEVRAGLYMSSAIDRYIRIAVNSRKDNSFRFYAADIDERKRSTFANLKYRREDRWSNYIKVAIQAFVKLGFVERGLNITLMGDIPQQIGLASSTAVEVAAAIALRGLFNADISNRDLAGRLLRTRETFFGKGANLVDYEIIMNAEENKFTIYDELTRELHQVETHLNGYRLLIVDSHVPRIDVEQEIRQRKYDIRKGLEMLSQKKEGDSLRNFAATDLIESTGNLPENIRRRSLFVVEELKRVSEAEDALHKQDFQALARVLFHSHEGLRDLYEVSCPEVDWLVKRAQETDGVAGARMTGVGFGGCTYTIIKEQTIAEYKKRLEDYERIFGFRPIIYEVGSTFGARTIDGTYD